MSATRSRESYYVRQYTCSVTQQKKFPNSDNVVPIFFFTRISPYYETWRTPTTRETPGKHTTYFASCFFAELFASTAHG